MDLKFTIDADYKKASQAFKELAAESEDTRKKIEKYSSSFETKKIDEFKDKQRLLVASLTGTKGEVAAMTTAQKNYQHEIERLIKSGLDPESSAIQRLRNEHDNLAKKIKDTTTAQKAQEDATKAVEKAALGMAAAIGASIVAIGAITQKTAEAGDQFAKTARIIGMTAETFQELDYAAKMSGVDNLQGSLEKLNKSVADVRNDTGTLTSYLKQNDKQLLDQLKNVNSNEEAFNLLMGAIKKAPNEFAKAELAQAAFGKSGQKLILLANEGAKGIENLREEARKYGVISNEAAANSEAYLDAQARLKAALQGVGNELTAKLLPGLTDTITKIADFIAGIDDWEEKLDVAKTALIGLTAALVTFVAVSKGAATISAMTTALKGLLAVLTGPAGIAAAAIGGLVTAIGFGIKALQKMSTYQERMSGQFRDNKEKVESLLSSYEKLNPGKKIDEEVTKELIRLYPSLTGKIDANNTSVEEAVRLAKEQENLQVKGYLSRQLEQLQSITRTMDSYAENLRNAEQQQELLNEAKAKEPNRDFSIEAEMIRAGISESKRNFEDVTRGFERTLEDANVIAALYGKKLTESLDLEDIPITITPPPPKVIADVVTATNDEILEQDRLHKEDMLAAEAEYQRLVSEIADKSIADFKKKQEEKFQFEKDLENARVKLAGDTFGAISDLAEMGAKDNIGLMILSKAAAAAQAAINSYLAYTQVLADPMTPAAIKPFLAGGILTAGLVQQARIIATAIPSAETGGRFVVPNSVGSDTGLMKVNAGEEINVTPRGQVGFNQQQNIIVQIERQTIFDVVNDGIRSGDVLIAAVNY